MRGHVGLLHGARAADIRNAERHADNELTDTLNRASGRQRVERLAIENLCMNGRLHVDDG